MKSSKTLLLVLIFALLNSCGGGSGTSSGGGTTPTPALAKNMLAITVNGSLCSANSYPNKPCVSVTICTPGTSSCQTINDILLDTGSTGLRIFKQALTVPLSQVSNNAGPIAECLEFGDGTSDWGPIQMASVILGNEPAVQVPIQVIDSTFGTLPATCSNADKTVTDAGFNGILGISSFLQDCGPDCSNTADNGRYYTCNGPNCSGTTASLSSQVQNPVAFLPQDNNGVIVQLPSLSLGGSIAVNGYLVLGIGTQSNNTPSSSVKTFTSDLDGNIVTTFNDISYTSFFDTGTNGLFFPSQSSKLLPDCRAPDSDWFCPSSIISLSATNAGVSGPTSDVVLFQIGNFDSLINSNNNVFVEIGGDGGGEFAWGLPFFFGRNVYVGIEGQKSSLGSGTYFAY